MDERNATNQVRAGRVPAARARLLPRPWPLPNRAQISDIVNLTPGRNRLRSEALARSTFVQPIAGREPNSDNWADATKSPLRATRSNLGSPHLFVCRGLIRDRHSAIVILRAVARASFLKSKM